MQAKSVYRRGSFAVQPMHNNGYTSGRPSRADDLCFSTTYEAAAQNDRTASKPRCERKLSRHIKMTLRWSQPKCRCFQGRCSSPSSGLPVSHQQERHRLNKNNAGRGPNGTPARALQARTALLVRAPTQTGSEQAPCTWIYRPWWLPPSTSRGRPRQPTRSRLNRGCR